MGNQLRNLILVPVVEDDDIALQTLRLTMRMEQRQRRIVDQSGRHTVAGTQGPLHIIAPEPPTQDRRRVARRPDGIPCGPVPIRYPGAHQRVYGLQTPVKLPRGLDAHRQRVPPYKVRFLVLQRPKRGDAVVPCDARQVIIVVIDGCDLAADFIGGRVQTLDLLCPANRVTGFAATRRGDANQPRSPRPGPYFPPFNTERNRAPFQFAGVIGEEMLRYKVERQFRRVARRRARDVWRPVGPAIRGTRLEVPALQRINIALHQRYAPARRLKLRIHAVVIAQQRLADADFVNHQIADAKVEYLIQILVAVVPIFRVFQRCQVREHAVLAEKHLQRFVEPRPVGAAAQRIERRRLLRAAHAARVDIREPRREQRVHHQDAADRNTRAQKRRPNASRPGRNRARRRAQNGRRRIGRGNQHRNAQDNGNRVRSAATAAALYRGPKLNNISLLQNDARPFASRHQSAVDARHSRYARRDDMTRRRLQRHASRRDYLMAALARERMRPSVQ